MPTSKSSTSSEDYKAMLDELLAVIHRDGGQYTVLAGYAVSVEDAKKLHLEMRRQRNALQERIRHLVSE